MKWDLHTNGLAIDDTLREHIDRRLSFALSRFAPRIAKVDLFLADQNGPKGGLDKSCRIVVRLRRLGDVTASVSDSNWTVTIDRVTTRIGHNLRRELDRRHEVLRDIDEGSDTALRERLSVGASAQ